jgi:hypothetical protein
MDEEFNPNEIFFNMDVNYVAERIVTLERTCACWENADYLENADDITNVVDNLLEEIEHQKKLLKFILEGKSIV